MQKTDEFMVNRLTWKAAQYKLPTEFAFYFKDLSPDLQQYLNKQIDIEISGSPVVLYKTDKRMDIDMCSAGNL